MSKTRHVDTQTANPDKHSPAGHHARYESKGRGMPPGSAREDLGASLSEHGIRCKGNVHPLLSGVYAAPAPRQALRTLSQARYLGHWLVIGDILRAFISKSYQNLQKKRLLIEVRRAWRGLLPGSG